MSQLMVTRQPSIKTASNVVGLAKICDWFVSNRILKIRDVDEPEIIFLSVQQGYESISYFVREVLPKIVNVFSLIIASSDATFPYDIGDVRQQYFQHCRNEIQELRNCKRIKNIYVENLDSSDSRYCPIPLGILKENVLYDKYQVLLTDQTKVHVSVRSIDILCCHRHRLGIQWDKRKHVTKLAQNNWNNCITNIEEEVNEEEFMRLLFNSKFCICVQGGGIDPNPKCWQAILCGCIPIIETSTLNKIYERLPVVFIDKWDAETITKQKMQQWYEQLYSFYLPQRKETLQLLSLDYWADLICSDTFSNYKQIAVLSPLMIEQQKQQVLFFYGSDIVQEDVTTIAFKQFVDKNGTVSIPADISFNKLFGDVHIGVPKSLKIIPQTKQNVVIIHENRILPMEFHIDELNCKTINST